MKLLLLFGLYIFSCLGLSAQVKDSARLQKKSFEAMFANDDTLTRNDCLLTFEKVFQVLNKAYTISQPVPEIKTMALEIGEDDSTLNIIRDRLSSNNKGLNVRSLEMFTILLSQIKENTRKYARELNNYDSLLDSTKKQIYDLRNDTVIHHIFKDSVLRASFKPEIQQLRSKYRRADSVIKYVNILIDNTSAQTSDNLIAVGELEIQADGLAKTIGFRVFSKERRYLWEASQSPVSPVLAAEVNKALKSEKRITQYYFSHTHFQLSLLVFAGILFFFWIFFNFRSLIRRNKLNTLAVFQFRYINPFPLFASLVFMLNIAPLFDLDAPAVYIDTIEFFLMIILTFSFRRSEVKNLYHLWIIFIVLFLLSFSRYLGLPFYLSRWLSLIVNCLSFLLGIYALSRFRKKYHSQKNIVTNGIAIHAV